MAVMSVCPVRGCGRLTAGGRCAAHVRADNRRRHLKQVANGVKTPAWQELREERLELDGRRCQLRVDDGCTGVATTVHLAPELGGDHRRARLEDLTSACAHCHGV